MACRLLPWLTAYLILLHSKTAESDNRELDKLVAALGRNKATWRRALQLHEWLLQARNAPRMHSVHSSTSRLAASCGAADSGMFAEASWLLALRLPAFLLRPRTRFFFPSPGTADWLPPRRPPVHHAHPRVLAARPGGHSARHLRLDAGELRHRKAGKYGGERSRSHGLLSRRRCSLR